MHQPVIASIFSSLTALCLLQPFEASAQSGRTNQTTRALKDLFAAEWDYTMQQNPTWASRLGDRRWNDRWEDASLQAIQRRHARALAVLDKLRKIDRRKLHPPDQLNYDLFKKEYEISLEENQFRWYLVPLNQREGIQTADELADALRFETVKDYEDWIARLRAFPRYLDQTVALMREGIRARMLLPKITMQRVPNQIDKQIVDAPEASPFFKPLKSFPDSVPEKDRARLTQAAKEAISYGVIPAYKGFKEFFVKEYLPASFDQVGAWQMSNGDRLYAFFVRKYTTTQLTPKEIHETGLAEVKRIGAAMQAIMDKVGFQGTRQEFFKFLRTDPRFYFKSGEELLDAYRALTRRIDPQLVKIFRTLPRTPYGVEPIPDKIAPAGDAPQMGDDGPVPARIGAGPPSANRAGLRRGRAAEFPALRRLHRFY